jgi:hypothetical protein
MILATRSKEGTFDTTPSANDHLRAGDTSSSLAPASRSHAWSSSCVAKICSKLFQPQRPRAARIVCYVVVVDLLSVRRESLFPALG